MTASRDSTWLAHSRTVPDRSYLTFPNKVLTGPLTSRGVFLGRPAPGGLVRVAERVLGTHAGTRTHAWGRNLDRLLPSLNPDLPLLPPDVSPCLWGLLILLIVFCRRLRLRPRFGFGDCPTRPLTFTQWSGAISSFFFQFPLLYFLLMVFWVPTNGFYIFRSVALPLLTWVMQAFQVLSTWIRSEFAPTAFSGHFYFTTVTGCILSFVFFHGFLAHKFWN